jgi:hypothetical protein
MAAKELDAASEKRAILYFLFTRELLTKSNLTNFLRLNSAAVFREEPNYFLLN